MFSRIPKWILHPTLLVLFFLLMAFLVVDRGIWGPTSHQEYFFIKGVSETGALKFGAAHADVPVLWPEALKTPTAWETLAKKLAGHAVLSEALDDGPLKFPLEVFHLDCFVTEKPAPELCPYQLTL